MTDQQPYNANKDQKRFQSSLLWATATIFLLFIIKFLEELFGADLSSAGIRPGDSMGWIGIFSAPFIHGDWVHLISNSFALFTLLLGTIYFYGSKSIKITFFIAIISGFWVYLFGRPSYHIGASGVVYGLMFFLLTLGFYKGNRSQLSIAFAVLFLYGGGMFSGMIPRNDGVSWEGHLAGALAGILIAWYYRLLEPFSAGQAKPFRVEEWYGELQEEETDSENPESSNIENEGETRQIKLKISFEKFDSSLNPDRVEQRKD